MTASVRELVHVQLFMTTSINFGLRIITASHAMIISCGVPYILGVLGGWVKLLSPVHFVSI